jgi:hypothetical protein
MEYFMKHTKISTTILTAILIAISFAGCKSEKTVEVALVIKNATAYELESVIFVIPHGSLSPMHDLVNPDKDGALQPNEEREVSIWMFESDFDRGAGSLVYIKGDDEQYPGKSTIYLGYEKKVYEITCDSDMNFDIQPSKD